MSDKDAREEARKIVEAVETRWAARTQAPSEQYESLHWENVGYEVKQKVYAYQATHNGDGPDNFEMAEIVKRALRVSSHVPLAGTQAQAAQWNDDLQTLEHAASVMCAGCHLGDVPTIVGQQWLHTGPPGEVSAHTKNYRCLAGPIRRLIVRKSVAPVAALEGKQ